LSQRKQNSARPGPDRARTTPGAGRLAPTGRRKLIVAVALGLALATAAAYWQVARHDFVNYDDSEYVYENPLVLRGLTAEGLRWAWTATEAANWHPLTWLSHMLDVALFGPSPGAHHLVNLALHLANTLLLFFLLRRLTGALWRSAFVAALFALHPLHVESVAWVAERKDVLCTLFFCLTLWAYAEWVKRAGWWRYGAALLFFALGLMAKPMLVTLPFVLLLLDVWPLGRWRGLAGTGDTAAPAGRAAAAGGISAAPSAGASAARLIVEKMPFFALAAASSVITFIVQREGGAMGAASAMPLEQRLVNAVVTYAAYIWKMVWPVALTPFYPYDLKLPTWKAILAAAALVAATLATLRLARRRPYLAVGWLWYLGMLVPVIGLVQVGQQAMADRYTYLPLVGVFIILAWLAADLPRRQAGLAAGWRPGGLLLGAAAASALLLCLAATYRQTAYWHNSTMLWNYALRIDPENYVAHINLAAVLEAQGRRDEAEQHYRDALRVRPNDPQANNNLGSLLAHQGKPDEAMVYYLRALKGNPKLPEAHNNLGLLLAGRGQLEQAIAEYHEALRLKPAMAQAHNNLGLALAARKDLGAAIEEYRAALRLKPDLVEAEQNLAGVFILAGRPAEAVQHARRAVQLQPGNGELRFNLGLALTAAGNLQEAAAAYREALRLQPDHFGAAYRLAWILAAAEDQRLRDGGQALALARRLCETTAFADPLAIDLLAAAQAENGNFDEAVRVARQAADLARTGGRDRLAADIQVRLELYRQRRPCRALPGRME